MPYIYSLAGMTWLNDYTIMRPLFMDFGSDPMVKNTGDQYMFGPSIMVAPVYRYKARSRDVYLPGPGGWYDFYSGNFQQGSMTVKAEAPYETIPLFIKEGSIIPVGPDIQYTGEKPADPVTLFIYTGKDGDFSLYEDEGTNYNYEKGAYSIIEFNYDDKNGTLTIGSRRGSFKGMTVNRIFNIVWINPDRPVPFNADIKPDESVNYSGRSITVKKKIM
jgi:alpha-D-xyloside xylohydrolase